MSKKFTEYDTVSRRVMRYQLREDEAQRVLKNAKLYGIIDDESYSDDDLEEGEDEEYE